jgi:hypothetical protein
MAECWLTRTFWCFVVVVTVACSTSGKAPTITVTCGPNIEANDIGFQWPCMSSEHKIVYAEGLALTHDIRRLLKIDTSGNVTIRATGERGKMLLRKPVVVTDGSEHSVLIVPILLDNDKWMAVSWKFDGEFDHFEGLHPL